MSSISSMFIFSLKIRRPQCSTLFPYTTLFRSNMKNYGIGLLCAILFSSTLFSQQTRIYSDPLEKFKEAKEYFQKERSEEHTSELQSPCNLVCRLLLEKKK